ncbi:MULTISPECIES: hypothetical protein [Neobacillus]|jgi:hypothetical protein|uniref:Phosphatase n=1 Tax=Neobacillus rhizosphaerae TaxID=2880965 RepID=A0ABN8KMS3_9BACI|nr:MULTISPECIES: hypothetical protein [Neobacillus]CAH2714856.1 hypothetical protein BACCIP111895_02032 [Neobacillus rhizosphaerae]
MKKAVVLLFSLSLLVFLSPSNVKSSKSSVQVAQTPITADHPILPPL